jgi:hypothetical protein
MPGYKLDGCRGIKLLRDGKEKKRKEKGKGK